MRRKFLLVSLALSLVVVLGAAALGLREGPRGRHQVARLFVAPEGQGLLGLEALGAERGGSLGPGRLLVRLPEERVKWARLLLGGELEPYPPEQRLAPELRPKLSAPGKETIVVDITLFAPGDKEEVKRLLESRGGKVLRGLEEGSLVLRASVPASALGDLASSPGAVFLEPAQERALLNDRARDLTGAAPLQVPGFLFPGKKGLTGEHQIVGLADSGLDAGSLTDIHPDLRAVPGKRPKVVLLKSWAGSTNLADPSGHGTHLAATIAGTGAASGGKFRGVAPGASIYFQALRNKEGKIEPPPDLGVLFAPAYAAGVRVHVNGWGGSAGGYYAAAAAVDRFVRSHPDFLVVFGAGNAGPGEGTLTPEAHTKNGLVVGASQVPRPLLDPAQQEAGAPASFSSRGPTRDGRIKPELFAPGAAVSARARAVSGNFPAAKDYTYLAGTSVAAAVAGGCAALLREYFLTALHHDPSAALLKASLINGARCGEGFPGRTGFGVLDLAGTVLAFEERCFSFADDAVGVGQGEEKVFTYRVTDPGVPLKVTLAWTDPAAVPGSGAVLVNDLDLVVRGPDGEEYLGNSFLGFGKPDTVNNVEQVLLARPKPGVYQIIVRGSAVRAEARSGRKAQDFALVYGQPLERDVVAAPGSALRLASGRVVALAPERVRAVRDDSLVSPEREGELLTGAVVYLAPGPEEKATTYVVGRTWRARGVQVTRAGPGFLVGEVNPAVREGGFFVDPRAREWLFVNGRAQEPGRLLPGGEVLASVCPATQTIWRAEVRFDEHTGFLEQVDVARGEVKLFGDPEPYRVLSATAFSYLDELVEADRADLPFGAGACPDWRELLPGLKARLVCAPGTREVLYLGAYRALAVGTLAEVSPSSGWIAFRTGAKYLVHPGISVSRDRKKVSLEALAPGDHAVAVLLPGTREVLALVAHSRVVYGRIVHVDPKSGLFSLTDSRNDLKTYRYSAATRFFRWGLPGTSALLQPGSWARLFLDPGSGEAWRVDLAETGETQKGVVISYDPSSESLATSAGEYLLTARTAVVKNGYPVTAADLVPGEEVELLPLAATVSGRPLLAAVNATARKGVGAPSLSVAAPWRAGEVIILAGVTSGDKVYLYREDAPPAVSGVGPGGRFVFNFTLREDAGAVVQVVAVASDTGGVAGQYVTVSPQAATVVADISGHWAAREIGNLAAQGFLKGYPDGSFRPDVAISRAEFVVLLVRALGRTPRERPRPFSDAGEIPAWARPAVSEAVRRGLVEGYPDGSFRPGEPVRRAEAAVLLARAFGAFAPAAGEGEVLLGPDSSQIPEWALPAARFCVAQRLFLGYPGGYFRPAAFLTRAEAAVALWRFLENLVFPRLPPE